MAIQHSPDLRFPVDELRQGLRNMPGGQEVSQAVRIMYRVGYAAKGLVFFIIGALALALTLEMGGKLSDSKGALSFIGQQPFGQFMLLLMGFSLLGYVLWRFAQAIFNVEHKPHSAKNTVKRIGYAISGLIYLSLAVLAIRGFMEGRVQQGSEGSTALTAKVMDLPGGQAIIIAVGAIIIGVGLVHAYLGFSERFMKDYNEGPMREEERKVIRMSGKIGLPARGLTFVIIGYFFIQAGLNANPSATKDTKGVLRYILSLPFGETILQVIAVGFMCYAFYCFAAARFRQFA